MKNLDAHTVWTWGVLGKEAWTGDRNDCTVKAYAIATGMSYTKASELLTKFGRLRNKGVKFESFVKSEFNDAAYILSYARTTPAQFLKTHPIGRFVLRVKGHVFAVVDGKIYNDGPVKPKKRVDYFVEFY